MTTASSGHVATTGMLVHERLTLRDGSASRAIWAARVTPDYFETAGVRITLRRGFVRVLPRCSETTKANDVLE